MEEKIDKRTKAYKTLINDERREAKSEMTPDEVALQKDIQQSKSNNEEDLVEVIVSNLEFPGADVNVVCGPSNNLYRKSFKNGFKYTIPIWVDDFINTRMFPIYEHRPDGTGKTETIIKGYTNRFSTRRVR